MDRTARVSRRRRVGGGSAVDRRWIGGGPAAGRCAGRSARSGRIEKNVSYYVCFFLDTQAPWPYIGPVNARSAPAAAHGRLSRCSECRSLRRRSARTGYKKAATDLTGRSGCTTRRFPSVRDTPSAICGSPERGCRKKMSISRPVFLTGSNSGICRAAPAAMPVFRHFRRAPAPARHFDRSGFENHGIEKKFL